MQYWHDWMADRLDEVVVAHPDTDSDFIMGWALVLDGILYAVYVKAAYRRVGVATQLVRACGAQGRPRSPYTTNLWDQWRG